MEGRRVQDLRSADEAPTPALVPFSSATLASSSLTWWGDSFLGPSPFWSHPAPPVSCSQPLGGIPGPQLQALSALGPVRGCPGPTSLLRPKFVPIHPASQTGFIPPGP